jgi:hypothetical protein
MRRAFQVVMAIVLAVTSASALALSWDDGEDEVAPREPQPEQASRAGATPVRDATPGAGDTAAAGAPAPRAATPAPARTGAAAGEPASTDEAPADRSYREFYQNGANLL